MVVVAWEKCLAIAVVLTVSGKKSMENGHVILQYIGDLFAASLVLNVYS